MLHSDVLIVVAECGVALAGFASLISVFGSSRETLDFTRLLGMVKNGLTAAAFSLLPFAPASLGAPDSLVWRGSGMVLLVIHTTATVRAWSRLARLRRAGRITTVSASYFTYPAGVLSIFLALAASLSSSSLYAAGFYICSLLVILSSAGVLFLSVFSAFIRSKIDAA